MQQKKQVVSTKIPRFDTEAEEACWWDKNRKQLDAEFADAIKSGAARRVTPNELRRRLRRVATESQPFGHANSRQTISRPDSE
jgi:hypothetical protein